MEEENLKIGDRVEIEQNSSFKKPKFGVIIKKVFFSEYPVRQDAWGWSIKEEDTGLEITPGGRIRLALK